MFTPLSLNTTHTITKVTYYYNKHHLSPPNANKNQITRLKMGFCCKFSFSIVVAVSIAGVAVLLDGFFPDFDGCWYGISDPKKVIDRSTVLSKLFIFRLPRVGDIPHIVICVACQSPACWCWNFYGTLDSYFFGGFGTFQKYCYQNTIDSIIRKRKIRIRLK